MNRHDSHGPVGSGNDYGPILAAAREAASRGVHTRYGISVLIPVYNRRDMLARTLAALTHQTHPRDRMQVVVADDGSDDGVMEVVDRYRDVFDLAYVRQPDRGYRLAKVRNLGTRAARHPGIVLLDADVMPVPGLVEAFARILHVSDRAVLLGMRRFVDASDLTEREVLDDPTATLRLPQIQTANPLQERYRRGGVSVDWRVFEYEKTDDLLRATFPHRSLVGAVAAYPRALAEAVGGYCEDYQAWGGEDSEFGYRLYNAGAYFIPVPEAVGIHQEPAGWETSQVDRAAGKAQTNRLMVQKVPLGIWRKNYRGGYEVPKLALALDVPVSTALQALDALARQDFQDFEVMAPNAVGESRVPLSERAAGLGLRLRRYEASLGEAFAASGATYLGLLREADASERPLRLLKDRSALGRWIGILDDTIAGVWAGAGAIEASPLVLVRKREWSRMGPLGGRGAGNVFAGIARVATVLRDGEASGEGQGL